MSFILDALRKSELERQRDAAARVMRIPVAQHKGARVPVWVTTLIIVLLAAVAVLAGTAWRAWHARAAVTVAATASSTTAQPAPAPRPKETARVAASAAEHREKSAPAGKGRPAQAAGQGSRKPASAPPARSRTETAKAASQARPPPPADPAALPSADELALKGVHVPALTLQLHVYSKDPSQRFVFINGTRYREGQKTDEGPVLVSVTPKGAVLSQQGREFFLPIQ